MKGLKTKLAVLLAVLALVAAPAGATSTRTFEGPVFGIDGTHRGLLVADASAGIYHVSHYSTKLVAELPGVSDVSASRYKLWAITGGGEEGTPGAASVYRIVKGEPHLVADLAAFEEKVNPDPTAVESNPYDIEALGHRAAVVADAAGNDLLKVTKNGRVKVLAVFPAELVSTKDLKDLVGCPQPQVPDFAEFCELPDEIPAEAVPTSVAIGPDGHYYVGELKGFPGPRGNRTSGGSHRMPAGRNARASTV